MSELRLTLVVSAVATMALLASQVCLADSTGRPDNVGIVVGKSSPKEVRDALSKYQPALQLSEHQAALSADPANPFVVGITGRGGRTGPNSYGETVIVRFNAPPVVQTAIFVSRESAFKAGSEPALATVEKALTDKYGSATFRNQQGRELFLAWAWTKGGNSIALNARHPCAKRGIVGPQGTINADRLDPIRTYLKAGCATMVQAVVRSKDELVQGIEVRSTDNAAALEGAENAIRHSAELSKSSVETKQQEALKRPGPKL